MTTHPNAWGKQTATRVRWRMYDSIIYWRRTNWQRKQTLFDRLGRKCPSWTNSFRASKEQEQTWWNVDIKRTKQKRWRNFCYRYGRHTSVTWYLFIHSFIHSFIQTAVVTYYNYCGYLLLKRIEQKADTSTTLDTILLHTDSGLPDFKLHACIIKDNSIKIRETTLQQLTRRMYWRRASIQDGQAFTNAWWRHCSEMVFSEITSIFSS